MGRSVYSMAEDSIGFNETFVIKGFLDDNLDSMNGFCGYKPVLGTIDGYKIEADDVFSILLQAPITVKKLHYI